MTGKTVKGLVCILLLVSVSIGAAAEEEGRQRIALLTVQSDGSVDLQHMEWNRQAQKYIPIRLDHPVGVNGAVPEVDPLFVQRVNIFQNGMKKNEIRLAESAAEFKSRLKKQARVYINQRLGNKHTPITKISNRTVDPGSPGDFSSYSAFKFQFAGEDFTTLVIGKDDLFFESDADGIGWLAFLVNHRVVEVDGQEFIYVENRSVTGALRHELVTNNLKAKNPYAFYWFFRLLYCNFTSAWVYDPLSPVNIVNADVWENRNHPAWTKLFAGIDDLAYGSQSVAGASEAQPMLMPYEGAVINLNGYVVPEPDENGNINTSAIRALFLTNLQAYDSKKKMILKVTAKQSLPGGGTRSFRLFKIKGNQHNYPVNEFRYELSNVSMIGLGQKEQLDKLKGAIQSAGTPLTLPERAFQKALKIEVQITGWLSLDGKKKKITRAFYIVNE